LSNFMGRRSVDKKGAVLAQGAFSRNCRLDQYLAASDDFCDAK